MPKSAWPEPVLSTSIVNFIHAMYRICRRKTHWSRSGTFRSVVAPHWRRTYRVERAPVITVAVELKTLLAVIDRGPCNGLSVKIRTCLNTVKHDAYRPRHTNWRTKRVVYIVEKLLYIVLYVRIAFAERARRKCLTISLGVTTVPIANSFAFSPTNVGAEKSASDLHHMPSFRALDYGRPCVTRQMVYDVDGRLSLHLRVRGKLLDR